MTEFVVTAAVVLVPLFLLVPLLGRFIDVQHSAIQAARYEAWEYTVHFAATRDEPDARYLERATTTVFPVKPLGDVEQEARRRFFSNTTLPIAASDAQDGWKKATGRALWTTHTGLQLYNDGGPRDTHKPLGPDAAPGVLGGVLGGITKMVQAVATVLNHVPGYDPFTVVGREGYFVTEVHVPVKYPPSLAPRDANGQPIPFDIAFKAQAGVLADGWNAAGKDYAENQTRGLVPTALLDNGVIDGVRQVIGFMPGFTSFGPDKLVFGHVDGEAVHPDRLDPKNGKHTCDPHEICMKQ